MDAELHWIAGLFEGEGSIQIVRASRGTRGKNKDWASYVLRVTVTMTDREPVAICHARFGGGKILSYPVNGGKPAYRWVVNSAHAGEVLREFLPAFRTERVKAKALIGIEFQEQKKRGKPPAEYRARQEAYFEQMRELNKRGIHIT